MELVSNLPAARRDSLQIDLNNGAYMQRKTRRINKINYVCSLTVPELKRQILSFFLFTIKYRTISLWFASKNPQRPNVKQITHVYIK